MSLDEEVAVLRGQARDRDAVSRVLEALGPELRGYLRGTMGSDMEADDLYGDLSVAILQGLPAFEGRSSVRTWAYRIAHNLVIKRRQRYSWSHKIPLDTQLREALPSPDSSRADWEQRRVVMEQVKAALSEREREIIILRAERGLSFGEIALIIGVSEGAAQVRYSRAKDKAKRVLSDLEARGQR